MMKEALSLAFYLPLIIMLWAVALGVAWLVWRWVRTSENEDNTL